MKAVCEANDILYVSDEVVTGFGRLGHFFASEAVFGVVPDMITVAKGITSGYMPLGRHPRVGAGLRGLVQTPCGRRRLCPRVHLFRPRRGLRRGPSQHRSDAAGGPLRAGAPDRPLLPQAPANPSRPAHRRGRARQPLHALRGAGAGPAHQGALPGAGCHRKAHRPRGPKRGG